MCNVYWWVYRDEIYLYTFSMQSIGIPIVSGAVPNEIALKVTLEPPKILIHHNSQIIMRWALRIIIFYLLQQIISRQNRCDDK